MGPYWGNDSEWFWAMLQFLVLAVSLLLIYRQLRIQSHTNMLTAVFELARKWNDRAMLQARKKICACYLSREGSKESWEQVATFFEEIGTYLHLGALSSKVIWDQYSYEVEHYWPILQNHVNDYRNEDSDPTWFENFEMLYNDTVRISKKRGVGAFRRDSGDLEKFAFGEIGMASMLEDTYVG